MFEVGGLVYALVSTRSVWTRTPAVQHKGPYRILERLAGQDSYRIDRHYTTFWEQQDVFHASELKLYHPLSKPTQCEQGTTLRPATTKNNESSRSYAIAAKSPEATRERLEAATKRSAGKAYAASGSGAVSTHGTRAASRTLRASSITNSGRHYSKATSHGIGSHTGDERAQRMSSAKHRLQESFSNHRPSRTSHLSSHLHQ